MLHGIALALHFRTVRNFLAGTRWATPTPQDYEWVPSAGTTTRKHTSDYHFLKIGTPHRHETTLTGLSLSHTKTSNHKVKRRPQLCTFVGFVGTPLPLSFFCHDFLWSFLETPPVKGTQTDVVFVYICVLYFAPLVNAKNLGIRNKSLQHYQHQHAWGLLGFRGSKGLLGQQSPAVLVETDWPRGLFCSIAARPCRMGATNITSTECLLSSYDSCYTRIGCATTVPHDGRRNP